MSLDIYDIFTLYSMQDGLRAFLKRELRIFLGKGSAAVYNQIDALNECVDKGTRKRR